MTNHKHDFSGHRPDRNNHRERIKRAAAVITGLLAVLLPLLHPAVGHTAPPQVVTLAWTHLSSRDGDLPTPLGSTQQTAALAFDVDGDGLDDFVIGTRQGKGPSLVWYQASNQGWQQHVIDDAVLDIEAGGAVHDIDADGDLDFVLGGDARSNLLWWWENPAPDFVPDVNWTRHTIKSSGGNKHHDQLFGDFDGDGTAELVFWNQGAQTLFLAEPPADPHQAESWPLTPIYGWTDGAEHEGLAAIDMDGNGVVDIVGGGRWFERTVDGQYLPHVIDDSQRFSRVAVGQFHAGGWPEVVFGIGDGIGRLRLYERSGTTWTGADLLGFDVDHGHTLAAADLNRDGFLDLFSAEMRLDGGNSDAAMRLLLGDGRGNFRQESIAVGFGNHESRLADVDGDGDLDIVGKPYNWESPRVDLWLNEHTQPATLDHWCRQEIDSARPWPAIFVSSGDLNGDAADDIVAGAWWYANPGVDGAAWERQEIGTPLNNMALVHDFDDDGDLDILGTTGRGSDAASTFVWAQNDGFGHFTILTNVDPGEGDFLQGVALGPFGAAGHTAVALAWHAADNGIQLLEVPEDPATVQWPWRKLSASSQDEALSAGDMDSDGDMDLLLGTRWLRNQGRTWRTNTLFRTNDAPDRNRLADLDGDGHLDAVVGYEAISKPGKVAWYRRPANATAQWTEHVIATAIGPMSLDVADMDNDGDLDVIVGEHNLENPAAARMLIYENRLNDSAKSGQAWREHVVFTGDEHHDGAHVTDIDGDGDMDIVSIGWGHDKVVLYRQTTAPCAAPAAASTAAASTAVRVTPVPGQAARAVHFCDEAEPLVFYEFASNPGTSTRETPDRGQIIADQGAAGFGLDLTVHDGAVRWLATGGMAIERPVRLTTATAATQLIRALQASAAFSIEVWIKPANVTQDGPARLVTLSDGATARNVTVSQGKYGNHPPAVFDVRLRTTDPAGDANGEPSLTTSAGTAKTTRQQVVVTHSSDGKSTIFVDGVVEREAFAAGDLSNWSDTFVLGVANEVDGGRPWLGTFYSAAIYDCALSPGQVVDTALR
ncbi:MAG: VCBS repeat-containing protein [Caldilineaceae bacterium]|nr:VCBS repeat-containing protein [Caldilineaceae bacterium]